MLDPLIFATSRTLTILHSDGRLNLPDVSSLTLKAMPQPLQVLQIIFLLPSEFSFSSSPAESSIAGLRQRRL